jgi:hypothetical protein
MRALGYSRIQEKATSFVIPAKAGIQRRIENHTLHSRCRTRKCWVQAGFRVKPGMTAGSTPRDHLDVRKL